VWPRTDHVLLLLPDHHADHHANHRAPLLPVAGLSPRRLPMTTDTPRGPPSARYAARGALSQQ